MQQAMRTELDVPEQLTADLRRRAERGTVVDAQQLAFHDVLQAKVTKLEAELQRLRR
jgi:hypothetical protein